MAVTVGQLRESVEIQQPVVSNDGQNGGPVVWATLATVRASVLPVPRARSASLLTQTRQSIADFRVEVRARTDVNRSMRVVWRQYRAVTSTLLEILSLYPLDADRSRLVLECAEVL